MQQYIFRSSHWTAEMKGMSLVAGVLSGMSKLPGIREKTGKINSSLYELTMDILFPL